MSLVDYASSSDEDESEDREVEEDTKPKKETKPQNNQSRRSPEPEIIEKLPDASLLLNSPTVSSVIGSRKRDYDGLPPISPRPKLPKGTLPLTKNVPDTLGAVLLPPQLRGRSNIVTEDLGKLFARKHAESSSQ